MIEWLGETEFNDQMRKRLRRLRTERGWSQADMASALHVPLETYKKYETRSPLPHYLLPRFAQLMDRDIDFLMTGQAPDAKRRRSAVHAQAEA